MSLTKSANDLTAAFDKFITQLVASAGKNEIAEPDVDTSTGQVTLDRDEVESLGIVALRKLAKENGVEEKKKADILSAFEEKGFFASDESADDEEEVEEDEDAEEEDDDSEDEDEDEDDEEEEDEEEDEDEGYSREDLEEKTLRELKAIAKEEGHSASDIKGLDQEGLIALILGEEDEDEDEEDEEEEDDDEADEEEDEDDEEEVEIDKETLEAMSDAELREIVNQFELKVPKKATRKTLIQTILDAAEEGDDDE